MRRFGVVTAVVLGMLVVPAPNVPAQAACNGLPVTISGTAGDDTITGTAGNDVIASLAGNDSVFGLAGGDTVCLGQGDDMFTGGPGVDTFVAEAVRDGSDTLVGDPNFDRVTYAARGVAVSVSTDGTANDGAAGEGDNVGTNVRFMIGGSGDDVLDFTGGTGQQTAQGGRGNDIIRANFSLDGDGGDDTLTLIGTGGGQLNGGAGNDRLSGGPVRDSLNGNGDDDALFGGGGDDTLFGEAGNDQLFGGLGDDTLFGEAGDDELIGQLGNDSASGDAGDDSYFAAVAVDGADRFNGGTGVDTANYGGRNNLGPGTVLTLRLDGVANDGEPNENDNMAANVENATGGTGTNFIVGNTLANDLVGGQSADVINSIDGISANDFVTGGFGSDACFVDPGDREDCEIN